SSTLRPATSSVHTSPTRISGLTTGRSRQNGVQDLVDFDSERSRQGSRDLAVIMERSDVVTASTNVLERVYDAPTSRR
ncbi:MAG: hypothetical protein ACXWDB_05785, partial [Aeromicrobium sp.]